MAMIAGPFTDEIVGVLMGQEKEPLAYGALFYDAEGRCCYLDSDGVWIVDTVLKKVAESYLAKPFFVQKFPEPVKDGYCLTEGSGTVWVPEFTEEEKEFLRNCGYRLVPPGEIGEKLRQKAGEKVSDLYPLACKTGVFEETALVTLKKLLKKIK